MSASQLDRIEMLLNEVLATVKATPAAVQESLVPVTKTVTMVKRGVTQNSSSPMWRCVLDDGRQVNVFMHSDPDKNNFNLIEDSGWGAEFIEMEVDEQRTFFHYPITVSVMKDGKWWKLVGVQDKIKEARSDIADVDSIKAMLDKEDF